MNKMFKKPQQKIQGAKHQPKQTEIVLFRICKLAVKFVKMN